MVKKEWNPPNCPQLRPIELYWAQMSQKLLKMGGVVNDEKQMLKKWNQVAREIDETAVRELMSRAATKTREFVRS